MPPSNAPSSAPPLSKPLLELCARLESCGVRSYLQGEGLLSCLRRDESPRSDRAESPAAAKATGEPRAGAAPAVVCLTTPERLLDALPRAVVTGERRRRITQATAAGPVDLLCLGETSAEQALLAFGLGPLCFGYRPVDDSWCDPAGQRAAFTAGRLELPTRQPNPLAVAPRRYWLVARLLAEYRLTPSPELVDLARETLPQVGERLPQAAPARRTVERILRAADPAAGLGFLREAGVTARLVPGSPAASDRLVARLPPLIALRWAAWLRGAATASVLVRFRVPHARARRIERLQAAHPLDRSVDRTPEVALRKLAARLAPGELDALFVWRRLELAAFDDHERAERIEARLAQLETLLARLREGELQSGTIRRLALDGRDVMRLLEIGPGPRIGEALAHLASLVEADASVNEVATLETELLAWADKNGRGLT